MKYIPIEEVQEGMVCNQTVYNDRGTLLIDRGAVINKAYIEGLKKFDIKRIAIQEKTPEKIAEAAEDIPQASPSLVTQQVISTCGSLLEEIEEYKTVKLKKHFHKMEQVIYSILEKPFMQACLEKEKQEDALYKHSLRTTLLAISMGIKKKVQLFKSRILSYGGHASRYWHGQTISGSGYGAFFSRLYKSPREFGFRYADCTGLSAAP